MLRSQSLSLAAVAMLLAAAPLYAQQSNFGLTPADSRPSLVTPPNARGVGSSQQFNPPANNPSSDYQNYNQSPPQYRPLESFPPANQSTSFGTGVTNYQSAPAATPSACECQQTPVTSYQPVQSLSPVALLPAAYSSNYVPPPPTSPYYANRVVYQRPVVYQQAVARPVVQYRPVAPVVPATPSNYYLRPIIPVQNVPAGVTIGRGVIGQPTVYVPGQPVRNFLRYLAP